MKHPLTQFSKTLELLGKQTAKEYQNIAVVRAKKFLQVGHVKSTVQYLSHLDLDKIVSDQ